MKSNNELEAKDLRIDDLEVDDEWQQVIVAYMETWFDVDRKFHLDINSQEGTWLNMTVFFNPYKDTVSILCAVDSDENYEEFYYEPTKNETEFIKDMIAQKLQIECARLRKNSASIIMTKGRRSHNDALSVSEESESKGKPVAMGDERFFYTMRSGGCVRDPARGIRLACSRRGHTMLCIPHHSQRRHDRTRLYSLCSQIFSD